MKRPTALIGVDTGGTFTDLVALVDGQVCTVKVLSTPSNPALAVLRGLQELVADRPLDSVTYASTVATNALLQRKGARVVLVTTAGFEDVIEIGRQNRPALYDLEPRRPEPLVPRQRRVGVRERVSYDGRVVEPLTSSAVRAVVRAVRRARPEAIAVCCLHAYANPRHERALGRALATRSGVFQTLSHQLVAEYREYERLETAVINAYVGPVMSRHLRTLATGLRGVRLRVMQSNGGAISTRVAGSEAVRTLLSGPAAGVIGAAAVARQLGLTRVITFDMGGTSTDVSLIDGAPRQRTEWSIGGLPLRVPAIDIHTVGAGGGSMARIDAGGALKVGPESAGADPGPACYGRGHAATVTDANLVLGRLLPDAFLGGRMRLDTSRARAAIKRIAVTLESSCEQAGEGVVRVVNAGMERAIRCISVERGYDPREFVLVAFGGAAGQHACELSAGLGIRRVVVPSHPGLLSACGAATANVQRDYVRTVRLTNPPSSRLRALLAPLERAAHTDLRAQGVARAACRVVKSLDIRYAGQSYEINVPWSAGFARDFHAAHRRLYGYADRKRPIEVVTLRVLGIGRAIAAGVSASHPQSQLRARMHRVRWGARWVRARIYERTALRADRPVRGPAVLVEFSATTFVPPGWRARVHRTGHLVLTHAR